MAGLSLSLSLGLNTPCGPSLPPLPSGYAFLITDAGDYIITDAGDYIIVETV